MTMTDEYDEEYEHVVERRRETCVYVQRRNGAYLISAVGEAASDAPPDQTYDAAASFTNAKRIARAMATEFGYTGPWRWHQSPEHRYWTLEGTLTEEYDRYVGD